MRKPGSPLVWLLIVVGVILIVQCVILSNEYGLEAVANYGEQTVDDVISEVLSMDVVNKVDDWPYGIKFATWNHVDEVIPKSFDEGWLKTLDGFIEPGKTNISPKSSHYKAK